MTPSFMTRHLARPVSSVCVLTRNALTPRTLAARFFAPLLLAMALLFPGAAAAHSLSMAVLSLKEVSQDQFVVSWERLSGITDPTAGFELLQPVFPEGCHFEPPLLDCSGKGLFGELGFQGLGTLAPTAVVHVTWLDDPPQAFTFRAKQPVLRVNGSAGSSNPWTRVAKSFTVIGVEHILLGWDHLLFVLGLVWLVGNKPRSLLKTITGFTVAHSVTLSAATLGLAVLPVPPVEAIIALSIVFVTVEAVRQERYGAKGWSVKYPWTVAFGFGLLHGFGFASALSELELPKSDLALSLLFFNVGVELGQIAFLAVVLALGAMAARLPKRVLSAGMPTLQYAAGTLAMFWFIERVAGFIVASSS